MSASEPKRPLKQRMEFRWWYLPAALAALGLLSAVYFFWPSRTHDIATVGGEHRWAESLAPPQRRIVWKPATAIDAALEALDLEAGDSLIRPQLAEGGGALFLTLQREGGDADIYAARLLGGVWQAAEPVAALNTEADDIGPVISADGQTLYLYSDRPGGEGGFDLYVSHRTETGWSRPKNLGPRINTPANEYDPAPSPDGKQLFFASNRTQRMHKLSLSEDRKQPEQWSATLRAQPGLQQFDLYLAARENPADTWQSPRAVKELNRATANEGAPMVSSVFLYFASDRPFRSGEAPNYDIYRGRIEAGRIVEVENLGTGINTPANETEPALSPEGFRIVFSSDRSEDDNVDEPADASIAPYALYASTAEEIVERRGWDYSRLAALRSAWWWILLGVLIAALLAALIWYVREVSLRRAPVPGFLLIALLIHLLVGTGSFFVYFGDSILDRIKKDFQEIVVATNMSSQNLHQSHEAGQESYEKIADLKSVETVRPTSVPRQVTQMPNVPSVPKTPVFTVPPTVTRELPDQPQPETIPQVPQQPLEEPALARRTPTQFDQAVPIETVELADAEKQPKSRTQPERADVNVARQRPTPDSTPVPRMLPRRPLLPNTRLEHEVVQAERPADSPDRTTPTEQPQLSRADAQPVKPLTTPEVETEQVAPVAPTTPTKLARTDVNVARQQPPPTPQSTPSMLAKRLPAERLMKLVRDDAQVERVDNQPVKTPDQTDPKLAKTQSPTPPKTEPLRVATEALAKPANPTRSDRTPKARNIEAARQVPPTQVARLPENMLKRRLPASAEARPQATDVTVERAKQQPTETTTRTEAKLNRTVLAAANTAETPQVATEQIAAPQASPALDRRPEPLAVRIARQEASVAADLPKVMRRPTDLRSGLKVPSSEVTVQRIAPEPTEAAIAQATNLTRATPRAADETAASEVATEELVALAPAPKSAPMPSRVGVKVDRRAASAPAPTTALALRQTFELPTTVRRSLSSKLFERVDELPTKPAPSNSSPELERASLASPSAPTGAVETESVADAASEVEVADAKSVDVAAVRRSEVTPDAPSFSPANPSTANTPEMPPTEPDQLARADTSAALALATAIGTPLTPARRVAASPIAENPTQVETADMTGAADAPAAANVKAVGVELARQGIESPTPAELPVELAAVNRGVGKPSANMPGERASAALGDSRPASGKLAGKISMAQNARAGAVAEAIETAAPPSSPADGTGAKTAAQAVEVGIARPDALALAIPFKTSRELGGQRDRSNPQLVIGSLAEQENDAPLSASPITSRLVRRPARAPLLLYADDNIGLQAMFRLRQGEAKKDVLEAFGGNDQTLAAVHRGLEWLAGQQHEDGHWSLNKLRHKSSGAGNAKSDPAATGFGLLPFLGDGNTHQEGKYKATVGKGVEWLVNHQKEDGDLTKGASGNTRMYSHGIASIALCEAYGMSKDESLREPAQRAIDFIVQAQHKPSGGWRYNPNQSADTSVVGWQVMALKSAQMAGLDVPPATLELVKKWLAKVEGRGDKLRGTFGYTSPSPSPAMSAEGLLCLQYLGTPQSDPRMQNGTDYLLARLPKPGKDNSYYWYYGTQVMFHMQGQRWQAWNDALRDMLLENQVTTGPMAGTWDPKDSYEKSGGRIYSTSMRLLMLEVYYRHLPLYQVLER